MAGPIKVEIAKTFKVPAARVFDAWLEPKMLSRWMFGLAVRDEQILHLKVDARVGGKFSFKVRRQDHEIDHIGTYLVIDRPHRLAFTWGIAGESVEESTVVIDITANADGCDLKLVHELAPGWEEYAERTRGGWTKMVEALASALA